MNQHDNSIRRRALIMLAVAIVSLIAYLALALVAGAQVTA